MLIKFILTYICKSITTKNNNIVENQELTMELYYSPMKERNEEMEELDRYIKDNPCDTCGLKNDQEACSSCNSNDE